MQMTLAQALDDRAMTEQLNIKIRGFVIGDFADSENSIGSISSPSFSLLAGYSVSEHGRVEVRSGNVVIYKTSNEEIQNLQGDTPLGSINYYDPDYVGVNLRLNDSMHSNLLSLLTDHTKLTLRVSFPKLDDKNIKLLPLMSYQIVYKQVSE